MVLVVEDDPDLAETIADVARDRRCRAICAHNGLEALDVLERERPALMLIDLFMKDLPGHTPCPVLDFPCENREASALEE